MLSQEDFFDKAKGFALLKDVEGKYFTYEEYKELIKAAQTDKNDNLVYLYANDKDAQYSYIETATGKGYSVLLMDGQLDSPLVGMLEQKFEKSRFCRVDGDTIDRLIQKENEQQSSLNESESLSLAAVFNTQLPKIEKAEFHVDTTAMGENALPILITQSEYMRRMKEMSQLQGGMSFYGEMPDMYNMVLNADHPLIKKVVADITTHTESSLKPIEAELKGLQARRMAIEQTQSGRKAEDISQEERDELNKVNEDIAAQEDKKKAVLEEYAKTNQIVPQLIDLALLQNGLLKGEALNKFLKRSVDLIK
jgi:molecular chaperone HtpG